jgi:hypothetical protein
MTAARLDQLNSHQGIGVKESSGVVPIRSDTADQSSQVNHQFGMEFGKQPFDIALARQVAFFHEGHGNLAASE